MSVLVRQIGREDAEAYRAIRLKALDNDPRAFSSDAQAEREQPLGWYEEGTRTAAVFLAFEGEVPIGMAGFIRSTQRKSRHIGHLFGLYVAPEGRRRGIGDRLVTAVLAHAARNVSQIRLGVGTYNQPAQALYHRHGFEIYGTEPKSLLVDGEYIDEHLMVRFLDKEDSNE